MKTTASPLSGGIVSGSGAAALYVFSGEPLPEGILSPEDAAAAAALLDDPSFGAKKGKIAKTLLPGSSLSLLYLVGLGERKDFGEDGVRSRTAELVRRAKGDGVSRISALLPVPSDRNVSCAVAEGVELGSYSFEKYKTRKEEDRLPEPDEFILYCGDEEGLSLGKMLACAQNMARDLANEPGNRSNPVTLAEYALAEARDFGLEAEVWDERKILEEGMEGLYSVGMASSTPPRLVRLSWKPEGKHLRKVVFVGKGITFDSGGLNIKPGDFIRSMKSDKSGACNVFALLRAAAKMKLPMEVHGIVPLAENMPGGKAFRPDDILRMRNGKTVEIDNTDAEGRLILADALSYASELRPDVIIDMATLTGACAVALGTSIAGLFTPDDGLAKDLLEAGKTRGERLWRLPEDDERIAESMKSPVADLVNSGSRYGGAIFAARFLREFVGEGISWAHLDIAGVDFNKDEYSVYGKGASGFGVRTCLQYLLSIL
ncbi:leucyl aminopeptidase [Aminivibrio sp.]|uniref:leucyl aminopeptidase n=1 Tax=Aminivibrio sp. TaxID=1872489 RepID=UPI001A41BB69|nr:leucyl aminopeptidase [Aminivibrio sp.]MBL3539653.1 leucyl aminopeptidase [Aminivibrio sp.]